MEKIAELNRDTSAALATIREWMNSLIPINRVPSDVLSLIPTHLPSQKDRFRVSFVCRHWRRTFLQNARLWYHLSLSKGEVYVKTLLERVKGSPLTILAGCMDPVETVTLLPPYTNQITELEFANSLWADIQRFSEIISGPLPLLRILNVNVVQGISRDGPDTMTPPSQPLFNGAVDLKIFRLRSEGSAFLSHFVFPNLTSFELSVASGEFHCSQLLDFLEALPMLQVVHMKIATRLSFEGIPDGRLVVLHNVETFCLVASDSEGSHELATDISCPSAKYTSLTHIGEKDPDYAIHVESFPFPSSLNTIIHQYTKNSIEEVTLAMETNFFDYTIACSLTFLSPDATTIKFRFEVTGGYGDRDDEEDWVGCFPVVYCGTLLDASESILDASKSILDVPLLADVKRLHLYNLFDPSRSTDAVADRFGVLFRSLGPLEELTVGCCDMRLCFFPFLYYRETRKEPVAYPLIRMLTISSPRGKFDEDVAAGLVKLAKAQHEQGVPFERVTIRVINPPAKMEEWLRPWVDVVDCCVLEEAH